MEIRSHFPSHSVSPFYSLLNCHSFFLYQIFFCTSSFFIDRLNKEPPNIGFRKKDKGGINLTSTVKLLSLSPPPPPSLSLPPLSLSLSLSPPPLSLPPSLSPPSLSLSFSAVVCYWKLLLVSDRSLTKAPHLWPGSPNCGVTILNGSNHRDVTKNDDRTQPRRVRSWSSNKHCTFSSCLGFHIMGHLHSAER